MDLAVLRIERGWAKWPGWFDGLERAEQLRLLAMDHAEHPPPARGKAGQ